MHLKEKTTVNKPPEPVVDKEVEERRLEEEMRKRRERIEKWRNEKKVKEPVEKKVEESKQAVATSGKAWNLEDDDDEEDATSVINRAKNAIESQKSNATAEANIKQQIEQQRQLALKHKQEKDQIQEQMQREQELLINKQVDQDEEDPLDKYMEEITKVADKQMRVGFKPKNEPAVKPEANQVEIKEEKVDQAAEVVIAEPVKKFTIMTGVAKVKKDKGHIMEQDIDGLEYASEDEAPSLEADVASMAKIKSKNVCIYLPLSEIKKIRNYSPVCCSRMA
jgi:hypothetical protein